MMATAVTETKDLRLGRVAMCSKHAGHSLLVLATAS